MRCKCLQWLVVCGIFVCLGPSLVSAHGVVGKRKFIEPFVAEDANPKDEFVLAKPGHFNLKEGNTFSVGYVLEKRFSKNFSLALENEWVTQRQGGEENASGFQNLGVLLKYALFRSAAHEFILSSGFEVEVPIGEEDIGAEQDVALAPLLLYAKGFGDLPPRVGFLRPFALMGDAGFDILLDNEETEFFYDFVLMYDLQYLQDHVKDVGLPWPMNRLLPVVEFNFETVVNGSERTTEAFITPGLVYRGKYVQLGIAGQFPLNSTTNREFDSGILFSIDLFYDDITSALGWAPFVGAPATIRRGMGYFTSHCVFSSLLRYRKLRAGCRLTTNKLTAFVLSTPSCPTDWRGCRARRSL